MIVLPSEMSFISNDKRMNLILSYFLCVIRFDEIIFND